MPHTEPINGRKSALGAANPNTLLQTASSNFATIAGSPNPGCSSTGSDSTSQRSHASTDKLSNIRSKFRELGLTPSSHGALSRSKSITRNSRPSGLRKSPILPLIKIGEFMPDMKDERKLWALRKDVAERKVGIQILEARWEKLRAQRKAVEKQILMERVEREREGTARQAKFDAWAGRLNRRTVRDVQLWTARVAKREPSVSEMSMEAEIVTDMEGEEGEESEEEFPGPGAYSPSAYSVCGTPKEHSPVRNC